MRQRQIIKDVAENNNLPQKKVKEIMDDFLQCCRLAIYDKNEIDLEGFGLFFLQKIAQKNAKIPGKEGTFVIPPHFKLQFKPSESLKDQLESLPK